MISLHAETLAMKICYFVNFYRFLAENIELITIFYQIIERQEEGGFNFDKDLSSEVYSNYTNMLYSNIWGNALHLDLLFPGVGKRDGKLVKLMEVQQKSCAAKLFSLSFQMGILSPANLMKKSFFLFFMLMKL